MRQQMRQQASLSNPEWTSAGYSQRTESRL
jgi:hypothetical protein